MGYMKDSNGVRLDSFAIKAPLEGVSRTIITRGGAVFLGDSITAWGNTSFDQRGQNWWNVLGVMTGQRIRADGYYATAGFTMEQIEATYLPSVLALDPAPGAAFLAMGTNNLGTPFNIPVMAATLKRFTDQLSAKNIIPVLCTLPPRTGSPSGNQQLTQWNAYIRTYASRMGYPLMDNHEALVDPATGEYAAGMLATSDGTGVHPSDAGHTAMAALAANNTALVTRFPDGKPYLARGLNDSANLIGNSGLFQVDTNADGVGDGWQSALSTGATASIVTDGSVKGKWQRLAKANGQAGTAYVFRDITITGGTVSTITATAATDTFTKTSHGLTDGDRVQFTSVVTGLTLATNYWVRDSTANTFKVSASKGGAAVDLGADGTVAIAKAQLVEGDKFTLACRLRTAGDGTVAFVLQALCMGANKTFDTRINASVDGTHYISGTVVPGTTSVRISLMVVNTATAAVTADFGQVTFVNQTALSL